MTLAWPGWAGSLQLVTATNLRPNTPWQPVTNAIIYTPEEIHCTITPTTPEQYFRLQTP